MTGVEGASPEVGSTSPGAGSTSPEVGSTSRSRRVLAGIALVLACLLILISTVAVWTHQAVFNTDRFTALVTNALDDPALIDPLAARISSQVVTALDVQDRIASRLPGPTQTLALPITLAIQDAIDSRLQKTLADPRVQAGLVRTVAFTHARIMDLLRGEPDAISVEDGYIVVAVFPVVEAALEQLQTIGLLPAGVQIPDLSSPDAPDVLANRLDSALGITLPPDFGTIRLMKADRLLAARAVVQAFDVIVIGLLIVTAIMIAAALWLAKARLRMLIYIGLGSIIAFALARLAIHGVEDWALSGIADGDLVGAIRVVADSTLDDLRGLTTIVLIAASVVVVAAFAIGRRERVGRDRQSLERIGLVVIAFVVLWIGLGLEVALLAAALVVGLSLIIDAVTPSWETAEKVGDV